MNALHTRDVLLPMLALLSMARTFRYKLSELSLLWLQNRFTASDNSYTGPPGIACPSACSTGVASELLAPQSEELVTTDTSDGLRMTFANGHIVHLWPSGNVPELRY